ncbi:MAG: zinc ABC transporter substrate-binding protein [Candidatus Riflebacteria bacterium]|nr:zinc ABC transporter substrate-binding protein [Candidatus Riflebacteria bacterium]
MKFNLFVFCALLCCMVLNSYAFASITVVTTTPDLLSIVNAIGGNRVKAISIGRGHEDPHFVEPKPSFMISLSKAQMVFCIGLDLEIWLKPLLEGGRNLSVMPGNQGYIDCSQGIDVKEIPQIRVDPSMGDIHPNGNPHYMLDPENGLKVAALIAEKLVAFDPDGANEFNKNLETFTADLSKRIPLWKEKILKLKNRRIACFHNSWRYFADAFGLEIVGFVEPKPGIPPTGREITSLVEIMRSKNCRILIREKYYSDSFSNTVAEKVQGKVLVLPAQVEGEDTIKSYPDLFETIVSRIADGLAIQQ